MQRNLKMMTTVAAVALTASSAAAQTSGPKAVYWVSAETANGMGGMAGMGRAAAASARANAMAQAQTQARADMTPSGGYVGSSVGGAVGSELGGRSGLGGFVGGQLGSALGGGMFGKKKKAAPAQQQARAAAPTPEPVMASYAHNLTLQLGSREKPAGAPAAEHLPPAGLQVGPSLPLNTPVARATSPTPYGRDFDGSQMKGRMLIYWGCGEHAPAAPITIDFASMSAGKMPKYPTIAVNAPQAPDPSRFMTYGDWPNSAGGTNSVPANGSLVGAHTVRGNYSPEIHFALDGAHDFMAPLQVRSGASGAAGGGTAVSWNAVPGATGYFAWMMGGGGGPDGSTVVLWTSSATAAFMGGLMDYLPPAEVRRLVAQRTVLAPTTTQCIVPAEVVQAAPAGLLSMIAYGDEVNVADPPKPASPKTPWNVSYTVKARFKSTASTMLGMPSMD